MRPPPQFLGHGNSHPLRRAVLLLPFTLLPVAAAGRSLVSPTPAEWVLRNGWVLKADDR